MFSNRTRRQIKAKFVREEKLDSARLEEALSGKKKIDINFYERMTKLDFRNGVVPADPMAKFYDGLPTAESAVKLESNREASPGQELDLAALLRKKKEDTAGLGGWENSRAPREYDGNGQEDIPEEEMEGQEGQEYEEEHGDGEHADNDEEMHGQYDDQGEIGYRSPTPEQEEEEPFSFSGGIQLRVSG
ncbi:hypothetical protein P389DRAFT_49783 [Cystobasidium minutum MCA 4210]|uniref:uncharacterized protein n=1 Tax=Cystobasidium minutum MCA 4210 TaxID=1397322 RepID=UPI0034CFED1E|eukprot:jgi/Rhomi1/49783/CE49782_140